VVVVRRGVVVVARRGKWQAAGAIAVVGKAVLTLHPPLRPPSHNVNPRDGAQDMLKQSTAIGMHKKIRRRKA
jgi:hypothetical protein